MLRLIEIRPGQNSDEEPRLVVEPPRRSPSPERA
jgi:hypothetical protein